MVPEGAAYTVADVEFMQGMIAHHAQAIYMSRLAQSHAANPKLLKLKNVVLLPHMGSATIEGRIDMGEKVIINIKTFADGHKPPDRVLATMF